VLLATVDAGGILNLKIRDRYYHIEGACVVGLCPVAAKLIRWARRSANTLTRTGRRARSEWAQRHSRRRHERDSAVVRQSPTRHAAARRFGRSECA
jgi:hypothetical protein